MELETAITQRRSIRKYDECLVSKENIEKIITAGMWAPSACNVQGWKFIVIDKEEVFALILKHGAAAFLKDVKQGILVLYKNETDNLEYMDHIQSASACIENMLLTAHSLGIGACWVNNLPDKKKLRNILGIPKHYDPIALVSLGYYSQQVNKRPRKYSFAEVVSYNAYTFAQEEQSNVWKLGLRRIARKIYKKMPCKKLLFRFAKKYEKKFDN